MDKLTLSEKEERLLAPIPEMEARFKNPLVLAFLGDTVYGNKKPVSGLQGQCLHAVGLQFIHPRSGELVELRCGLPEEFQAQLKKLQAKYG